MNRIDKVTVSPEIWIKLYVDISTFIQEYTSIDPIWTTDENGDEVRFEEKQDEFIHIVNVVEGIMEQSGIVKDGEKL